MVQFTGNSWCLYETCLKKGVDVPVAARGQLAKLLEMLCTQYDRHLDQQEEDPLNRNDLIDEAINNTRGRALEALLNSVSGYGGMIRIPKPPK